MLTIPPLPKNCSSWKFHCKGSGPKFVKILAEEIVKHVLVHEHIKKKEIILELSLSNPKQMAELNAKFRNKDAATNVLSFPLGFDTLDDEAPTLLGSIFFCWQIIKDESEENGIDNLKHLAHLIVHSTLHLLGYTHDEIQDRQKMEAKEVIILMKLGIESPYLEQKKKRVF